MTTDVVVRLKVGVVDLGKLYFLRVRALRAALPDAHHRIRRGNETGSHFIPSKITELAPSHTLRFL